MFAVGGDSGEEDRGGIGAQEVENNLRKTPKLAPSNFSYLSIYINGNNNIEIIYQKV